VRESIDIPCLKIDQPIGQFYVGVIGHAELLKIAYVDQRKLSSEIDDFMGIQRQLSKSRVKKIEEYVQNVDATFPTSIIISIRDENCSWDKKSKVLTIHESTDTKLEAVAKILDGQHRVEGMKKLDSEGSFELSVTIFVDVDVATQANIFSTVNLAQTKVNRSLVYDLFSYEKVRSPQKSCHEIAVALNRKSTSPFFERVKRLGIATPGVENETLTQAAVVESLLAFVSKKPTEDRNSFMRKLSLERPSDEELEKLPFRGLWLDAKEADIAKIVFNFFSAVVDRWPESWEAIRRKGNVLPKTNGFKALMRFLKPVYLDIVDGRYGKVPTIDQFAEYLYEVDLDDDDFNIQTFPPGTSGESILFKKLMGANFED